MNEFESTEREFPTRKAGLALLGVAALAAIVGVVASLSGDDDPSPSQQVAVSSQLEQTTQTTTAPPITTAASASPASSAVSSTSDTSSPATSAAGETTQGSQNQTEPPQAQAIQKAPVRIYNNSTISGLANRASADLEKLGWSVAETGNYPQGQIPTTTVYYRPGTDEEAAAKQLAQSLRARVEPRFDGIANAQPGVIVIVTNDYQGPPKA